MGTKKNIIIVSALALVAVFVVTNPVIFGFCRGVSSWSDGTKYCYSSITDDIPETFILSTGLIATLLLIFTFLTYRMRDEVFRAWWNFARWIIPLIPRTPIYYPYFRFTLENCASV